MEHQFIPVQKKRKIAKVEKPEDANQEGWPDSLRDYVANSFALCEPQKQTLLGAQLTTLVGQANRNEMLDKIDWDRHDLPSACHTATNPKAIGGLVNSFTHNPLVASTSAAIHSNTTSHSAITATRGRIIVNPANVKRTQSLATSMPPTPAIAPSTVPARTMIKPSTASRSIVAPTNATTTRTKATHSMFSPIIPSASTSTKSTSAPNTVSDWSTRLNLSSTKAEPIKIKASSIQEVRLTPEELRKRSERAKRFQTDIPLLPTAKKIKTTYTPIIWDREPEVELDTVIVGTSTALEKPYFRLTSAADPATVRPLHILKKTFKHLSRAWRKEGNYSYICEQFKSMRQDLTVQRIQNEFTARVYETHARIALEKGDMGEYNQCQTQLKYLYQKGVPGCNDEFLAYRILYMLFSQNQSDINSMMEEMYDITLEGQPPCVQHALMVRCSLAKQNYSQFFKLYEDAPNMGGYLMDQFVGRERVEALIIACKAYKQGISLTFLAKELLFDNIPQLVKFLREHGVSQIVGRNNNYTLDTKAALPTLISQSKNYTRVDIKGQI